MTDNEIIAPIVKAIQELSTRVNLLADKVSKMSLSKASETEMLSERVKVLENQNALLMQAMCNQEESLKNPRLLEICQPLSH